MPPAQRRRSSPRAPVGADPRAATRLGGRLCWAAPCREAKRVSLSNGKRSDGKTEATRAPARWKLLALAWAPKAAMRPGAFCVLRYSVFRFPFASLNWSAAMRLTVWCRSQPSLLLAARTRDRDELCRTRSRSARRACLHLGRRRRSQERSQAGGPAPAQGCHVALRPHK